jgi:CubicO group peptidase (beta-lactamase class C family)
MLVSHDNTLYPGAFGQPEYSIFQVMSMTKPIATVAALQLVEQGKLNLDQLVARQLPEFEKTQVLRGFDPSGQLSPRPAPSPSSPATKPNGASAFASKQIHTKNAAQPPASPRPGSSTRILGSTQPAM